MMGSRLIRDEVCSLSAQMTADYEAAWYGTFKVALDNPVPTENSPYFPPEIYVSLVLYTAHVPTLWKLLGMYMMI